MKPVLALQLNTFTDSSKAVLLLWIICVFMSSVSHALASVHCCLVVTCWERADLLVLVLLVMFIVFLLLSLVVSWVKCGA